MLPGESDFMAQISQKLETDLKLGNALLSTAVSILTERDPIKPPEASEVVAYRAGHALCFKACKTYRSILLLTEIGASHDVQMLGRTLLETVLATLFVLVPRVEFGIKGFSDNDLTSELRARIYVAFPVICKYHDLIAHQADPRFSATLANIDDEKFRQNGAEAEHEIGPFWTARIKRRPRTYSGFTLRELAQKLDPDLSHWYAGIYGEQSKSIHAIDGISHVRFDVAEQRFLPNWHSSLWDVQGALLAASVLMWRCIVELHNRFSFGGNPHEDSDTTTELNLAIAMLGQIEKSMGPRPS
jgi:hypothetical protein